MKNFLYAFLLLLNLNCFAQDLFEYEFDEKLSITIPENSEEGEQAGQKFVKGSIGDNIVGISKSDKAAKLSLVEESSLLKLYQGVKDGMLKSTQGKLLQEELITIGSAKALHFRFSFEADKQAKVIDNFVLHWKKSIYTLQFIISGKESDAFKAAREKIIASIQLR